MVNKIITKHLRIIIILVTLIALVITAKFTEVSKTNQLVNIWAIVETQCDKWVAGEITRDQLAQEGMTLLNQLNKIGSSDLKQKTEVMIFDMVRGFDIEGNEYKEREKIDEEVLKYIYPKRKKAFEKALG